MLMPWIGGSENSIQQGQWHVSKQLHGKNYREQEGIPQVLNPVFHLQLTAPHKGKHLTFTQGPVILYQKCDRP